MSAKSILFAGALSSVAVTSQASDPAQCHTVRLSDPGWTDIQSTTAVATTLLKSQGYKTKVTLVGVPLTYKALAEDVGQLLRNLSFTLDMENRTMGSILDDRMEPEAAARAWLKANPQVLEGWLQGGGTLDGKPGLEAVRTSL